MKKPIFDKAGQPGLSKDYFLGVKYREAECTLSFFNSDCLPTEMEDNLKEFLEAKGVKFLYEVENDPLFIYVELPEGWRRELTDNHLWIDLVDSESTVQAKIFFKGSFHDRKAFMIPPEE